MVFFKDTIYFCMMKVIVPKLLIVLCLFSFTPLREMIKVPLLVFHYIEHLNEDPNITFAGFLDMHYLHGIVYDDDYARDMQLPFKAMDSVSLPAFVVEELTLCRQGPAVLTMCNLRALAAVQFTVQDPRQNGIFHPPRLA